MRSVVVVLPASMCAMMPMLRTFVRSVSTSSATVMCPSGLRRGESSRLRRPGSPAVVRERPVRLGHLVHVLATLDCCAQAVARVEQLVHQTLGHRLLTTGPCEVHEPAQREGCRTDRTYLDRDLVGRTADPAGPHLERGTDVLQSALEQDDGLGAGL